MNQREELQKEIDRLYYKHIPVIKESGRGDVARWFMEEVLCAPSKVMQYTRVYSRKALLNRGLLMTLYIQLVQLVFLWPVFLIQAIWWQIRKVQTLGRVLGGKVSYVSKDEVFKTKNE